MSSDLSAERPVETEDNRRRRPSFSRRLHAWWEGYYLDPEAPPPDFDPNEPLLLTERVIDVGVMKEFEDEAHKVWPKGRMEAAEIIWGQDMVLPGGAAFTVELAKPFALGPAVSLLDMSAGLGGGTRMLVSTFGVWVTGLEPDPDLANEGNARSRAHDTDNMDKKAPIRAYDPERFELKPRSFDCILARESFFSVTDKPRLYSTLMRGLKDRGQLIFTDVLLSEEDRRSPQLDEWYAADDVRTTPWTADRTIKTMKSLGFDLRISEDMTAVYRGHIMRAWSTLADGLNQGTIPKHLLKAVSTEADRWSKRVAAIDMGDLVITRFHAIKPSEGL